MRPGKHRFESHTVATAFPRLFSSLIGNALCHRHGTDPPGLRQGGKKSDLKPTKSPFHLFIGITKLSQSICSTASSAINRNRNSNGYLKEVSKFIYFRTQINYYLIQCQILKHAVFHLVHKVIPRFLYKKLFIKKIKQNNLFTIGLNC